MVSLHSLHRMLRAWRWNRELLATAVLAIGASTPARASSETAKAPPDQLEGLGDVIVEAIRDFLKQLFGPVESFIETHGNGLVQLVVGTPTPDSVFAKPSNPPWPGLYEFYWQEIIPVTLFLYGVVVGLVIFLESTSHLFSSYHRSKLQKRAVVGLLGILSWWWIGALSLRLVMGLTGYLVPDLSEITLFQTLSFTGLGILGVILTMSADLLLFVLVGLIYFLRMTLLYLYVLLMPVLIVFWIPGVGPFQMVAQMMKQFAGFYVPFLFMTVPVALVLRVAHILGTKGGSGLGGVGNWLSALVLPFLAILIPFLLVWQTGAVFFVADRTARQVSRETATDRAAKIRSTGDKVNSHAKEAIPRPVNDRVDNLKSRVSGVTDRLSGTELEVGSGGKRVRARLPGSDDHEPDEQTDGDAGSSSDETSSSGVSGEVSVTLGVGLGNDSGSDSATEREDTAPQSNDSSPSGESSTSDGSDDTNSVDDWNTAADRFEL